jgi:type IV pilus assembly protein PilB
MTLDDKQIAELLVKEAYATEADIKLARERAKQHRGEIVEELLALGLITRDLLGQALAEFYGVAYADLNSYPPSREQVQRIPETVGKKYRAVVFDEGKKEVVVTTADPKASGLLTAVKGALKGKDVTIAYSLPEDIDGAFIHYRKPLETRFSKIIESQRRVAPEIIDEIFADALVYRASDIHFEPQENEVLIRFRIDGILQEAGRIDKQYYGGILNRVKIQSHLRTDEHFAAQDGAMRYEKDGKRTDLRISIAPVLDGEKIAIRVLSEYVRAFTMFDLGLSVRDQDSVVAAAKKPYGMIIVTGPTGSGKTTTLYGLLKHLNRPEVNIATIEDPVEYKVTGVNHIQVNRDTNLTFANGLRSIVRQDPDIILVGEVRDNETAEISVNAALTGHLLLTTFHANDAATAIPRLLDMGVEPFLLSSTLELLMAQRLVRRICEKCRYSFSATPQDVAKVAPEAAAFFGKRPTTLYKGKGCTTCHFTGYTGRVAVFELIPVSDAMRDLVLRHPSAQDVWRQAKSEKVRSMYEDGIDKVKAGITTLEELVRVVPVPA